MSLSGPRLWSILLLLSCLLLATLAAPVENDGEADGSLTSAIEAVGRAKRASLRKKSSKPVRSLVRYRYPVHSKRSGGESEDDDDYQEFEDDDLASFLADQLSSQEEPVDLSELAKEVALDILMEEASQERQQQPVMKKKRKKTAASSSPLDDKRKKRMNSLMDRFMGSRDNNESELDNEDRDEDYEGDLEDEESVQDMIRSLASQGVSKQEIEALLWQLEKESRQEGEDGFKGEDRKRSSGEWRTKLPRGAYRWRSLHSQGEVQPRHHQQEESDDDDVQFFGRGFHRVGSGVQDDPVSRSVSQLVSTKRVQHPLMTKNAVSVINKRSAQQEGDEEPHARSRRSVAPFPTNKTSDDDKNSSLPNNYEKDGNKSDVELKADKDDVHTGLIRKKSVDWDDYFGFDKRSSGSSNSQEEQAAKEYYKTIADSLAYRRKRAGTKDQRDVEDALDAALRAADEERFRERNLQHVRADLVTELIENLSPEDLEQMNDQLAEELLEFIKEEEEEDDDDEVDDELVGSKKRSAKKRTSLRKRPFWGKKKKKRSFDQRRKRNSIKRRDEGKIDKLVAWPILNNDVSS